MQAMYELPDLQEVASVLIQQIDAENLLDRQLELRHERKQTKLDGSIVTEIDKRLQSLIFGVLNQRWPQYGMLGEEMDHSSQVEVCTKSKSGFWVLDPLDGTTNFSSGFPFFGVSLALVINGSPWLAVIYDPVRKECFTAMCGQGAKLNNQMLKPSPAYELDQCVANVDYKRLVANLAERLVNAPPYRSQRNLGTCVLEWCWLAAGRIQVYLHGGQKLWDYAAGYLILLEAGGAAITLSGSKLDCSKAHKQSVIAANNPELLQQWHQWVARNNAVKNSL